MKIAFRFVGKIPEGKFEITCVCGNWIHEYRLTSLDCQTIKCSPCGLEYTVIQQKNHWHIFVAVAESTKKDCPNIVEDGGRVYEEIMPGVEAHRRDLEDTDDCDI